MDQKFLKLFLPIFVLAALIPAFMLLAATPTNLKLFSNAKVQKDIRIWFEPSTLELKKGQTGKVNVFAQTDSDDASINSLNFKLNSDKSIKLDQVEFHYGRNFTGTINLGAVDITVSKTGEFQIEVPPQSVITDIKASDISPITSPANIKVSE